VCLALAVPGAATAETGFITVASTTSTDNSGLFRHLLPRFTKNSGVAVRVIAVGTGAALRLGQRGDADVVLVHDRAAELRFVAEGHGVARREVMYNDFVLIGPNAGHAGDMDGADPGENGGRDIVAALRRIARNALPFVSRGDDSGTHKAELRYWRAAAINPKAGSGSWYFEAGAGMGATLNIARAKRAHALTDRSTWLAFKNRAGLAILVEGDRRLRNVYGAMLVNPARHPHVKRAAATRFLDWLVSAEARAAIAAFRINGQQAFFPLESP